MSAQAEKRCEMSATVISQLLSHATNRADDVAITFLEDGETIERNLTFGALHQRCIRIAQRIARICPRGSRAMLTFRSGIEFIEAFVGCMYAGVLPVPVYPPRPREGIRRLTNLARDCGCGALLTTAEIAARSQQSFAESAAWQFIPWITTDDLSGAANGTFDLILPEPDTTAFLQYTSGSSAEPKGVMVTHRNLAANFRATRTAMSIDESTVFLSWLPLNHDMGLIGIVLQSLFFGNRQILMSPEHFLQRPMRWLRAISNYRATLSGGPNFAFDLCVRRAAPDALVGVDLSSWKVAFNGAEPIRADTLANFASSFAPYGFSIASLFPCYGLAEATLFAAGRSPNGCVVEAIDAEAFRANRAVPGEGADAVRLVSSGLIAIDHEVTIVDPARHAALPDGQVGEIWIRGPSVAAGYWNREELSEPTFRAYLDSGEGPYLRTGDLGFVLRDQLFVSGRSKDLIIIRGRNIYPQDIELTTEQVSPIFVPAGGAAFSESTHALSVVHEVRGARAQDLRSLANGVLQAIVENHDVRPERVVFIRAASLPRTTSGKVQRAATRQALGEGRLPVVADYRLQDLFPARAGMK